MKRFYIIMLALVFSFAMKAQNPIPNPGFETWVNDSSATGWTSKFDTTVIIVTIHIQTACKTTDMHSGSFAIKTFPYHLVNTLLSIDKYIPGFATIGGLKLDITNQTVNFVGGVPITFKPTKVTGWFKYAPVGTDSATVLVNLSKNDTIVGTGKFTTYGTTAAYTQFEANINYTDPRTPNKINVVLISSSQTITQLGSMFYVDDLDVVGGGAGITPLNALLQANVYPNPSSGKINIELPSDSKIRIFNMTGVEVYNSAAQSGLVSVDLSSNAEGIYFVEIDNGFNKQVKKINISR
jgi:hypothetical protein